MFKSFLYHCRLTRNYIWILLILAIILTYAPLFAEVSKFNIDLDLVMFSLIIPFILLVLPESVENAEFLQIRQSLPITKIEFLQGRYLFHYLTLLGFALLCIILLEILIFTQIIVVCNNYNTSSELVVVSFFLCQTLLFSLLLPFIAHQIKLFYIIVYFAVYFTLFILFTFELGEYITNNYYALFSLVFIVLLSIPLSYKWCLRNNQNNLEE